MLHSVLAVTPASKFANRTSQLATISEYLSLARVAYSPYVQDSETEPLGTGILAQWERKDWANARWNRDGGFHGGVFAHPSTSEIVVAFSGTQRGSASVTHNLSNVRVMFRGIPNMAGPAYDMVVAAKARYPGREISLVGHSLGGALAQVVGFWSGRPFISFNGPGMKIPLIFSRGNIIQSNQRRRTRAAGDVNAAVGICIRVSGDIIGSFGDPVGISLSLTGTGTRTHLPEAIESRLGALGTREPDSLCVGWADHIRNG
jgi:hypothetical protein